MGRICKTKAGLAGCGAADTQERERGRCKEEIKRKKKCKSGRAQTGWTDSWCEE